MKKSSIFKIVFLVIIILLIATLFYEIYQVKSFKKDLRPATEIEKQEIIEILNENINTTGYEIIFGNVLTEKDKILIQVQLKKGNSREHYLIDLNEKRLIGRYNE
jgi:hypothetical protein